MPTRNTTNADNKVWYCFGALTVYRKIFIMVRFVLYYIRTNYACMRALTRKTRGSLMAICEEGLALRFNCRVVKIPLGRNV